MCEKIRYDSQLEANTALLHAWEKGKRDPNRREIRTYPCPGCGGFHLTSKPKRETA